MAKRSDLIAGRYLASGCSRPYCGWREGKASPGTESADGSAEWRDLMAIEPGLGTGNESAGGLALIRRLVAEERRQRSEQEAHKRSLEGLLSDGQRHIDHLEAKIREFELALKVAQEHIDHLEAKTEKAVADFRQLEEAFRSYRTRWLVRGAHRVSRILRTADAKKGG